MCFNWTSGKLNQNHTGAKAFKLKYTPAGCRFPSLICTIFIIDSILLKNVTKLYAHSSNILFINFLSHPPVIYLNWFCNITKAIFYNFFPFFTLNEQFFLSHIFILYNKNLDHSLKYKPINFFFFYYYSSFCSKGIYCKQFLYIFFLCL